MLNWICLLRSCDIFGKTLRSFPRRTPPRAIFFRCGRNKRFRWLSYFLFLVWISSAAAGLSDSTYADFWGGGGTPYFGLYGEAPPERGTFYRL